MQATRWVDDNDKNFINKLDIWMRDYSLEQMFQHFDISGNLRLGDEEFEKMLREIKMLHLEPQEKKVLVEHIK